MMSGSFSRAIREDLARHPGGRACCARAEVAALVRTAGSFHIRAGSADERYGLHLATTVQAAARMVYSHFKAAGVEATLLTRRQAGFRRRLVYEVHLDGSPGMLQVLNDLGVLSDSFRLEGGIPGRILQERCCRKAFLRGCLIGAGSVNDPQREAHLEILTPHEDFAAQLRGLIEGLDLHPGVYVRRGSSVVYLKGREEVVALLAYVGAQEAALRVEEQSVVKEVRARANRVANCDQANLRRTSAAALEQLEAIDHLERAGALDSLPDALREMAELRREYPYLTLRELAHEADGLSRSALNHRLRRLVRAAEESGFDARPNRPPARPGDVTEAEEASGRIDPRQGPTGQGASG
jgi:cell division protein WhiA